MGNASLRPLAILPQFVQCSIQNWENILLQLWKCFSCFTDAIGLPGEWRYIKLQYGQKSEVAARILNKVVVERGNSKSKEWDFGYLDRTEAAVIKLKWCNVRCFTVTYENKNFSMLLPFCQPWHLTWQNWAKFFRRDVLTLHRWKLP